MALSRLQQCVEHYWYSQPGPLWLLYPLEVLYRIASKVKQARDSQKQTSLSVPVLVVGNISVGGTGKTPALVTLLNFLVSKGLKPGVISRGYGRESNAPVIVDGLATNGKTSSSHQVGDEPLLIFKETACPVSVHHDRQSAATYLLKTHPECNVILADDGLQHYKLKRDFELALVDAERVFGNGHLLPLGPLRESPQRLKKVDWILANKKTDGKQVSEGILGSILAGDNEVFSAYLHTIGLFSIADEREVQLESLLKSSKDKQVEPRITALSAIGNPQSFYTNLRAFIADFDIVTFKDHHQWAVNEVAQFSEKILICTAKDAIKLSELAKANPQLNISRWCYLKVELKLPEELKQKIYTAIVNFRN